MKVSTVQRKELLFIVHNFLASPLQVLGSDIIFEKNNPMKVHPMIFAGLIGCFSIPNSCFSQTSFPLDYGMALTTFHSSANENGISANEANVSSRAVLHFHKLYPQASKATWSNDQSGSSVRFVSSNQSILESYDGKGRWTSTISQLKNDQVPSSVVNRVYEEYRDYQIVLAESVRAQNGYGHVLALRSATDSKVVLVTDDEIQVLPLVDLQGR